MDYASHAPLPSLRLAELGHFRAHAGRPVIPFSGSANMISWAGAGWANKIASAFSRLRIVALLYVAFRFAVTTPSPGAYSLSVASLGVPQARRKDL